MSVTTLPELTRRQGEPAGVPAGGRDHRPVQAPNERGEHWHLITCEYPPDAGGVADYTFALAGALRAEGHAVDVWGPGTEGVSRSADGVTIHRVLGDFRPADLAAVGRALDESSSPRRLLVQWVPHGYGLRSMNVPFCLWLRRRARAGDRVELMVHEAFLAFGEGSWRQDAAALVHRIMTVILLRATRQVWSAIPSWGVALSRYRLGRRVAFSWLPVHSTIPVSADAAAIRQVLARRPEGTRYLIGHFGSYTPAISCRLREITVDLLSERTDVALLLIGSGGPEFRRDLLSACPEVESRVCLSGPISAREVSHHLSACDVMVQPYPDGVSSRRTSVMAALAHGLPVVTSAGRLTEPCWAQGRAVALVDIDDARGARDWIRRLIEDPAARTALAAAGHDLYARRFDIRHTVEALHGTR